MFAFSRNVGPAPVKAYVDYYHAGLLIDWGNPDFGHMRNLYAPGPATAKALGRYAYSEIGIGLLDQREPHGARRPMHPEYGANQGLDVGPVILTQEFGWRSGNAELTGALYRDADADHFYTPGEGVGGQLVQAVGLHGEGTFAVARPGTRAATRCRCRRAPTP